MASGNHVRAILDSLLKVKAGIKQQRERDMWTAIGGLKHGIPPNIFESLIETMDKYVHIADEAPTKLF
jgi:hypothetical protein